MRRIKMNVLDSSLAKHGHSLRQARKTDEICLFLILYFCTYMYRSRRVEVFID